MKSASAWLSGAETIWMPFQEPGKSLSEADREKEHFGNSLLRDNGDGDSGTVSFRGV